MVLRQAKRDNWRSFCSRLDSVCELLRIKKFLSKDPKVVNAIRKLDGLFTITHEKITKVLLAEHFQTRVLHKVLSPTDRNCSAMDCETSVEIVTKNRNTETFSQYFSDNLAVNITEKYTLTGAITMPTASLEVMLDLLFHFLSLLRRRHKLQR